MKTCDKALSPEKLNLTLKSWLQLKLDREDPDDAALAEAEDAASEVAAGENLEVVGPVVDAAADLEEQEKTD